jgi:hypothetical protein
MSNQTKTINYDSNNHKIRLGLRLVNYIESSGIQNYPAVYLASGLDLEFPLVLRARRIIMIDPKFINENNIGIIRQKILKYDPNGFVEKQIGKFHFHFTFQFDFGYGLETVNLDLFARTYQDFNYLSPIGYIIEFNNELDHCLYKSELLEKLIMNGIIIDNQESPLRQMEPSIFDLLLYGKDPDTLEDKRAANMGLKTIRIENVPFAVYQKVYNSSRLTSFSR